MSLKNTLIRGATDFTALCSFLDKLMVETDADSALFRVLDLRNFTYPVTLVRGKGIFTSKFFKEYDSGTGLSDPQLRIGLEHTLRPGSVYICHEHFSEEFRQSDEYFSEFLPRYNLKWFGGYLIQFNQYGSGFGIARTEKKPHFSKGDKKVLESVTEIFTAWSKIFMQNQIQKLIAVALETALIEKSHFAACIDAYGMILWQNENAKEAFDNFTDLSIRDNTIKPRENSSAEMLLKLLNYLGRSELRPKQPFSRTAVLSTKDGSSFSVKITRIDAEKNEYSACGQQGFLITGNPLYTRTGLQAKKPGDITGLSKKEMRVTEIASEGRTAPEIAVQLGVAPSTIQTHFKRIYKKLGINSKGELSALYTEYKIRNHL